MFRLTRLIYRMDYELSEGIVNSPGTMMRYILENKAWKDLAENKSDRSIRANYNTSSDDLFGTIHIGPTTINGQLDSWEGIALDIAHDHAFLHDLDKTVAWVHSNYALKGLERIGLRIFVFRFNEVATRAKFFEPKWYEEFQEIIGPTSDLAVILCGTTADNINYRFQTGPAGPEDRKRYFAGHMSKEKIDEAEIPRHDYMFDLDLYEKNIQLPNSSFVRWARTKWETAGSFADFLQSKTYGVPET